ncbi:MAG: ABC transporter permease [Lentisphaerae bacterium]|jgi:peptide/nickel transport system permease protein|nr:ABC transporter permease [Lentisphaerota bacterium]MBT4818890.1 ABC transporter permease [Lentisphaerota bacterium]MBT5610171.1 ABC transporter permease [Lentisphaerota bacterium]MBT7057096.1 ABC transporter permease [Lentisphaerota bacterium]MBT7846181.1 ABC transporter permease [Lentisphaerota bacterium]
MALFRNNVRDPERVFRATQWQLIWWKFSANKLAMLGLLFLGLAYLTVLVAEFAAPSDPRRRNAKRILAPPTRIRFTDEAGTFHLRPFIYPIIQERNPETLRRSFKEDRTHRVPLGLFVRGDRYTIWGMVSTDLHLFGTGDSDRPLLLLGADRMGRDLFSRIIAGGRISLSIGLVGIALSVSLGILIGGVSGYYGGPLDTAIQRCIEIIISIPRLPLWMGLSVALPPDWSVEKRYLGIVIILSLMAWPGLARSVRGKFMAVKEEDFVMAAHLDGAGPLRIILKYLLPSFLSHIIAGVSLAIPAMILGETSLSFLGLGLQAPAISWGVLLKDTMSIRALAHAPWLLFPGLFIIFTVLSFNFVGDGLRDAADPYAQI